MGGRRWPDLFVVGAPRAGTSSLWDYLDQHPQIFMSRLKEPHFFTDAKPGFVPVVYDEETYLRLFARAADEQLAGEATPTYLGDPAAPGRIARVSPNARILVLLREPIARAYSAYWHRVRYARENRPFLDAVRAELADPVARTSGLSYVGGGLYADALERYLGAFDGRVLVLFLAELAAHPRRELRRTLEFLGVDPAPADSMRLRVRNATSLPRNAAVARLYGSLPLRSVGARIVPSSLQPLVERILLRRSALPPMQPEARRLLEEYYAPEPAALERILGRAVPWAATSIESRR